MRERQRVVLITGANRGIGFAAAKALQDLGWTVIVAARKLGDAQAAAQTLGGEQKHIYAVELNVTKESDLVDVSRWVTATWGQLDALVNNAGVLIDDGWGEQTGDASVFTAKLDTIRTTMETNVYGPLRLCQVFMPGMRAAGFGRVVNVSSGMGQLSDMQGGYTAYRLSKTALNALTRIIDAEVKDHPNVKINTMCPGWVHTRMGGKNAPRTPQQGADTIAWLVTLPEDGPSGGFFRDRKPIAW